MKYQGSCHCGKIRYDVEGELGKLVECNCSHCQRKGYLLWFLPRAALELHTPEEELATYTFNKHVIRHHFCPDCGCAPFGFGKDQQGNETVAVNARCLENIELGDLERMPVDGRSF